LNCSHCAVQNPEYAKFCKSCGQKLFSEAAKPADAEAGHVECPQCHAQVRHAAKFCAKCGSRFSADKMAVDEPVTSVEAALHEPLVDATPDRSLVGSIIAPADVKPVGVHPPGDGLAGATSGNKSSFLILGGALLVLVISGGAWLMMPPKTTVPAKLDAAASKKSTVAPVKLTHPVVASAAAPVQASIPESAMATPPNDKPGTNAKPDTVTVQQAAQQSREDEARRKASLQGKRQLDDAARQKAATAALEKRKAEEARKAAQKIQVATSIAKQTPQQLCADRNFITRGGCEARECEKTEHASTPFCKDLKQRQAQQPTEQVPGF